MRLQKEELHGGGVYIQYTFCRTERAGIPDEDEALSVAQKYN
jgi:hypothetical protein